MKKPPTIHLGVPDKGNRLVPWCEMGFASYLRAKNMIMTTVPSQVDCKFCKKSLISEDPKA